jgi:putative tricarboxylic transport membrane protein
MKLRNGLIGAALVAGVMLGNGAHAQDAGYPDYPHDTVTLITSSGPGGGGDIFLRQLTSVLGPRWGINFVVESVSGSGGVRAMQRIQDSPTDGTVFYGVSTQHVLVSLLSDVPVSYTDMKPVVNVIYDAPVIYVPVDFPHATLGDLITWIRANPGKFQWGVGSAASGDRMAAEVIKRTQNLDFMIATHDSGGTQLVAVLGGSVPLGTGDAQEVQQYVQTGKLRVLAALTEERLPNYPDVMTAKEQGIDSVEVRFRGIVGHKDVPDDIVRAWEQAIALVVKDPDYIKILMANDQIPSPLPSAEFDRVTNELAEKTRKIAKQIGLIQ